MEVVIDRPPPPKKKKKRAEILGFVAGTTTKPLDDNANLSKRCSRCNNTHPGLTDKCGNVFEAVINALLFDQTNLGHEGLGGTLHAV